MPTLPQALAQKESELLQLNQLHTKQGEDMAATRSKMEHLSASLAQSVISAKCLSDKVRLVPPPPYHWHPMPLTAPIVVVAVVVLLDICGHPQFDNLSLFNSSFLALDPLPPVNAAFEINANDKFF